MVPKLVTSNHVPKNHVKLDFPAGELKAAEERCTITHSVMCDYSVLHIYVDISSMHTICHAHNTCKHLCVFPHLSVNVFIALVNCGGKNRSC